jgi:hypothetical protein
LNDAGRLLAVLENAKLVAGQLVAVVIVVVDLLLPAVFGQEVAGVREHLPVGFEAEFRLGIVAHLTLS